MAATWFLLHCSAHGRSTPVKVTGQDGIPALRGQMSLSALESGSTRIYVPRIYVHCSVAKPLLTRPMITAFEITIGLNLMSPVNAGPHAACSNTKNSDVYCSFKARLYPLESPSLIALPEHPFPIPFKFAKTS